MKLLPAFRLFVACVLLAGAMAASAAPRSLAAAARGAMAGTAQQRIAFVEAAVAELVAAHQRAAHRAGKDGVPRGVRWAASTRAYNETLTRALNAAHDGAKVRLVSERDGSVRVIVGQRPVRQFMITSPDEAAPDTLERAVLRRYLALGGDTAPVGELAAVDPPPPVAGSAESPEALHITVIEAPPRRADEHAPAATAEAGIASRPAAPRLSPAPPRQVVPPPPVLVKALVPGDDGLRCAGDDVRHRILYDHACAGLLAEARALAAALLGAARQGQVIDWNLPARPQRSAHGYTLAVNAAGGTVELPMPNLAAAPELLVQLLPWAHTRLYGGRAELSLTPPARLVYAVPVAQN